MRIRDLLPEPLFTWFYVGGRHERSTASCDKRQADG